MKCDGNGTDCITNMVYRRITSIYIKEDGRSEMRVLVNTKSRGEKYEEKLRSLSRRHQMSVY